MADSGSSKTDVEEGKGDKKEKDKDSKKGKGLFARARSLSHLRGAKKEKRLETPTEGSPRRKSTGDGAAMEEDAKEALAKEDKNEEGEGTQEGGEKTKKKKIKKANSTKELSGSKKNSFESDQKAEKSDGDDDDDAEGADGTESEGGEAGAGVEKTKKSKKRDEGKRSPGGKQRREKSKEKGERRSKGKGEKKEKKDKEKDKESKGKEKEKKSPERETKEKDDESRQIARKIPSLSRMKMTKIASPRDLSVNDDDDAKLSLDEPTKIVPQARNRSKVHSTKSATITPNNQMRGNDTSRVVRSVALPIDKPLSLNMAIDEGTVRIPLVQSYLRREGKLSTESVTKIFELALEILKGEPNVLMIDAPCCVFGDLHGQFYDLMNLLDLSGTPPNTQCLFLGDYVDRGMFGLETVLYLLSFKINFPKMFWMLRGNHESRQITQNFNFHRECVVKYGEEVYDLCMQVFDAMPLAAVVHADFGNFFCVHGGIGPDVMQLRDIQKIDRFQETPFKGPIASLLWSDPISPEEYPDMTPEDLETFFFRPNEGRGSVGWLFGHRATNTFLSKNNFITLIRGHEVQQFGIAEHYFGVGTSDFPKCITLFSAPNYCEIYNNKAAYLKLLKDSMDYEVVDAVDHPYILPDFMNGISFSLSFVVEIFAAMLLHTAHKLFRDDDDEEEVDEEQERKLDEMFKKSKASVEAMKKQREERMQLLSTNIHLQKLIKDTPNKSPFEMAVKFDKKVEMTGKPTKNSLRRIKSTPF